MLFLCYLYNTVELDAGDRFELPMHLAYETGVVATLPAIILFINYKTNKIICQPGYKFSSLSNL